MPALVRMDRTGAGWRGTFSAMAGPCEVLLDTDDSLLAHTLTQLACVEAHRIEAKFSRYRDDSVLHAIHAAAGFGPPPARNSAANRTSETTSMIAQPRRAGTTGPQPPRAWRP